MATTAERAALVGQLTPTIKELDPSAQAEAVRGVIDGPDRTTTNELWKSLVIGLLILIGVALLGLIYLLADDQDASVALTAFTALLTGLVGLFAPSPVADKTEGGSGT
jgi:hypothetical protein